MKRVSHRGKQMRHRVTLGEVVSTKSTVLGAQAWHIAFAMEK